jgi:hypothetical protein
MNFALGCFRAYNSTVTMQPVIIKKFIIMVVIGGAQYIGANCLRTPSGPQLAGEDSSASPSELMK